MQKSASFRKRIAKLDFSEKYTPSSKIKSETHHSQADRVIGNLLVSSSKILPFPSNSHNTYNDCPIAPLIWKQLKCTLEPQFYLSSDVISIAKQLIGKLIWTSETGDKNRNGDRIVTCGRIVETEAYKFPNDKASHAYNNRKTNRNSMMYSKGGVAYVYTCYGLHFMANVVTNQDSIADAVLLRSIEPLIGLNMIVERRINGRKLTTSKQVVEGSLRTNSDLKKSVKHSKIMIPKLGSGPGNVTKSLAINKLHNGCDLINSDMLWITEPPSIQELKSYAETLAQKNEGPEKLNFHNNEIKGYIANMKWDPTTFNVVPRKRIGIESAGSDADLPWRFYIDGHPCVSCPKIN